MLPQELREICYLFTIFKGKFVMLHHAVHFYWLTKCNHVKKIDFPILHLDLLTPNIMLNFLKRVLPEYSMSSMPIKQEDKILQWTNFCFQTNSSNDESA